MQFIPICVSFLSSIIGAICGIGGGIIIKPVMDAVTGFSVSTIGLLSGVTVLCMATYSIVRNFISDRSTLKVSVVIKLGAGAALGGVIGKYLFDLIKKTVGNESLITVIQSILLLSMTIGTMIYTLLKEKIQTKHIDSNVVMMIIGILLGVISSFMGIGGGPMNLLVLRYFFSMETKLAVQNSLFIIFLSQIASLLFSIISGTVSELIPVAILITMAIMGILGGIIGQIINKKISSNVVDKLFIGLLVVIIFICIYNLSLNIM